MTPSLLLLCLLFGAVLLVCAGPPATAGGEDAWESLVRAERDFSDLSRRVGVRDSFLANFTDETMTFPPGKEMVVGVKALREGPKGSGLLTWAPIKAEVSAAGDLGWTTGPWELRAAEGGEPRAFGNYISIWKRNAEGAWKVLIDFGGGTPSAPPLREILAKPRSSVSTEAPNATDRARKATEELLRADRALGAAAAAAPVRAYGVVMAEDVRLHREGLHPALGVAAAKARLSELYARLSSRPTVWGAAASGDLGWTVGRMTVRSAGSGVAAGQPAERHMKFMRIWRKMRKEDWKLVLEVANPAPPPPSGD